MTVMDSELIQEAIRHAESVREYQPSIDFDSVMLHVESNYPDLSVEEEFKVRHTVRDRYYPDVMPGCYHLEYCGAAHVMIPLGNDLST